MKRFFLSVILLGCFFQLEAQGRTVNDTILMLENKIWRAELPSEKSYTQEMEFREGGWWTNLKYNGEKTVISDSYRISEDTIKTYGCKQYLILELNDSTLVIRYLPKELVIGNGPVKYINTINSPAKMLANEQRLDSIWRKEDIWNKGVADISGKPIKDLSTIEPPRWAKWDYDLTKYYVSQMKYPEELLKKNVAGYSVAMFTIDTLGVPGIVNILTTNYKEFDQEVIRLTKELPHCLPCRDQNGKRMKCFYTVYVPFLPQHYRDRVKKDSISEEALKHCLVQWETQSYFQKDNSQSPVDYIEKRISYNPLLLGSKKETEGRYGIQLDSYGEVTKAHTISSCGISEWDNQVLQIIQTMPHWTPAVNHQGKGHYRDAVWAITFTFRNGHAYVTEHGGESNEREHTSWQSDEWKIINRSGNELLEYTVIRKDKAVKGLLIRYAHPSGSIRTLTYTYPEDIAFADNFHAEVTLKDLNFDGQDDIAIPLGSYGNQRIQYEDGYLWDKALKTYVPVKQLKEIANPRIDKEERCLFSFSRESAASYHYERYEYVDTELVKTAELIQTYRQAGGKPLFTEKHYQKGKGMRVVHASVPIHEISHYWLKIVQK